MFIVEDMANHAEAKEWQHLISELSLHPQRNLHLFRALDDDQKIELLRQLTSRAKSAILNRLHDNEIIPILNRVDPDEATDFLQFAGKGRQERILVKVSEELKESVTTLLRFDPETAAGLMTLDYIQVESTDSVVEVAKKFRLHEQRTGRSPVILVFNEGKLSGYLPIPQLVLAPNNHHVGQYTKRIPTVRDNANHKEVIQLFKSYPHSRIAVLDGDKNVLGIIYSDDVLEVLHDQAAASLYKFAGVSSEETVADSAYKKVKFRYKWLIINLATAFLAAFTVGRFEETIARNVLLAVYMPIVAGMGGNAATQTSAVLIRGIALKQIELKTALKTLKNELGSGFVNGLINGLIVAAVVLLVNGDVQIAAILAFAMIANLLVAAFFGTIVPLIMSKLGKDPATTATIFITTATDVLGFLAFLGLAAFMLR